MKQVVWKGTILHRNSKAYELYQDRSDKGQKKFEKHMKEVNEQYKKASYG